MVGYTAGCWDLLHMGHIAFLERARSLCDRLIVGVASNSVVFTDKDKSPVVPLAHRLQMLQALKCVDLATPYFKLEFITHLEIFGPDILIVGGDWGNDQRHRDAEDWIKKHGKQMVRLPRTEGVSTSSIIAHIKEQQK